MLYKVKITYTKKFERGAMAPLAPPLDPPLSLICLTLKSYSYKIKLAARGLNTFDSTVMLP